MKLEKSGNSILQNKLIAWASLIIASIAYGTVLLLLGKPYFEVLFFSIIPGVMAALFFGWIGALIIGIALVLINLLFYMVIHAPSGNTILTTLISTGSINILICVLIGLLREYRFTIRELQDKINKMQALDSLTGVYNRRYAFSILNKLMEVARRYKENFVVSYIDIDDLKSFNDEFSQLAGDQVLEKMISIISASIRKSDYLCRLGGDEFLIIFQKVDFETAKVLMHRIMEEMEGLTLHDKDVEISYGMAEYSESKEYDVNKLIEEADRKMYQYKSLKRFS